MPDIWSGSSASGLWSASIGRSIRNGATEVILASGDPAMTTDQTRADGAVIAAMAPFALWPPAVAATMILARPDGEIE